MRLALVLLAGCAVAQADNAAAFAPQSLYIPLPTFSLTPYNATEPAKTNPVITVDSFGAVGDGATDDTTAIQASINSLSGGGTDVFTPGKTYRVTGLRTVTNAGVTLWGYGATVFADDSLNPAAPALAFELQANNDNVFGMTITTNLRVRPQNTSSTGIWIEAGDGDQLIDNRIEYTGTCIFDNSGTHVFISRTVCFRPQADGITNAGGDPAPAPNNVLVVGNVVRQGGDECISNVNYGTGSPTLHDVLVEYNDVGDAYWSNSLSVHGGYNITVRHNAVARVPFNSCLIVDSGAGFVTRNVNNVLFANNTCTDIQTLPPNYNPIPGVHSAVAHGAIYANVASGSTVTNVLFSGNGVTRSVQNAAQVQNSGTISGIGFSAERFTSIQAATTVNVQTGLDADVACSDLQLVDTKSLAPSHCAAALPAVTGSAYVHR